MNIGTWLAGELVTVRDLARRDARRDGLALVLFTFARLAEELDLDDIAAALSRELAGDLWDLGAGRPVGWAICDRRRATRRPYAKLPDGRECRNLNEWLVRQLVTIKRRTDSGDRRGAVVELLATARQCAAVLIQSEHKGSTVRALGKLLDDVLSLYWGKQPDWLKPVPEVRIDGARKRGPKTDPRNLQVRRTLVAEAYRMHRKLGGSVPAATYAVCRRAGCDTTELQTALKHVDGDRRSAAEQALAPEVRSLVREFRALATPYGHVRARALLLANLQAALQPGRRRPIFH